MSQPKRVLKIKFREKNKEEEREEETSARSYPNLDTKASNTQSNKNVKKDQDLTNKIELNLKEKSNREFMKEEITKHTKNDKIDKNSKKEALITPEMKAHIKEIVKFS